MTYLCHISEMTRTNVTFWVVRVIIRVEKSAVKLLHPSARKFDSNGMLMALLRSRNVDYPCNHLFMDVE